jgi:hypothetical protein
MDAPFSLWIVGKIMVCICINGNACPHMNY